LLDTVIHTVNTLEGSYALGVMCADEPDILIAIKKDNPLIIGVSDNGNFIASDVPAVLKHTNKVFYLNDKEIAVLRKNSIQFYNIDKEPIEKTPETITWDLNSAEKGGHAHFMYKEIMEQPKVLRETINSALNNYKSVIDKLDISKFTKIIITACGSAYNAGVTAKYVFERLCRFQSVETELASEFRYRDAVINDKTLVILISQSGETADTIAALREAKSKGAVTLSIVNVLGSTIAKETDYCMFTSAGPEIAVATTKVFSAQLVLLYILAIWFAVKLGKLSKEEEQKLMTEINALPEKTEYIINHNMGSIQMNASTTVLYTSIFFIGRNIDYAISLEGSLKLKEISYIHSEAYAGGELKHGTISLIEEDTLVVALSNCESLYGKIMSNVEQVISRGAKVLLIGSCPTDALKADKSLHDKLDIIKLPECFDLFSPSLSVIVLQLLAYYAAIHRGNDIDKPRNLAKSVTVE